MDNLMNIKIIEIAIDKGIRDIEDNPKRGIRNLVDLARHFANSPFQRDILELMQTMLKDLNSPYYAIVSPLIQNVDHENIKKFGINLAYNSWTYGSKKIRKYDYIIPWALIFNLKTEKRYNLNNDHILDIIVQGKNLGIYTYMFFIDNIDSVLDILKQNPDCAFVLYVDPNTITEENLSKIEPYKNIFFSILFQSNMNTKDFKAKIQLLLDNKFLFGLYSYYKDSNIDHILNNRWVNKIIDSKSPFGLLIEDKNCSKENASLIHDYISNSKLNQKHSAFLIDLYEDIAKIQTYVSMEDGRACFDNFNENNYFNTKNTCLSEVFSKSKEESIP